MSEPENKTNQDYVTGAQLNIAKDEMHKKASDLNTFTGNFSRAIGESVSFNNAMEAFIIKMLDKDKFKDAISKVIIKTGEEEWKKQKNKFISGFLPLVYVILGIVSEAIIRKFIG